MKKNCMVFVIFSLFLLLIMTGCMQQKPKEQQEIVIGVVWPFASGNNLFNEGIDLAVKEINSQGGINGKKLTLLKEDDGSQVVKGISIAETMAENMSVLAVIGHRNSFVSLPASAIYEQAGLTMLSPASTDPELTQNSFRYVFRNLPGDDEFARILAGYLAEQGLRRMIIYYSNEAYGVGLANSFETQANKHGIMIVDRFNYYSGTDGLKRLNNRWQAFGYDGIFVATSMPGGAQFIHDAGKAGIKGPFAAGNALDSQELFNIAGLNAEGTTIGSVFNPDSERSEVKNFVKSFRNEYRLEPTAYAALGYDAVKMIAFAIEKKGVEDRESLAEGLRSLGLWAGVCGVHELTTSGDDLGDLVVLKKLKDGKFVSLEK